ncbi:MAG: hypothetical protein ACXWUG_01505 [Polyangiales bacterium]
MRIDRTLRWAVLAALMVAAPACRVNKDDLKRWEKTLNGPDKLVAVLTHDKYEKDLRVEAAWSLVEMKKRGGQSIGLTRLIEELQKLPAADRKEILDGLWKRMAPMVARPLEPAGDGRFSDPSVTYKDATFALYSDEKLDLDPKLRDEMTAALTEWAVGNDKDPADKRLTAYETRMDNGAQAYGVEQVLRKLGLPAAIRLPSLLTSKEAIKSQRIDSLARIVVDVKPTGGDKAGTAAYEKARDELSTNFAVILKGTIGEEYIKAVKAETDDALKKAGPGGAAVLNNPATYKEYMGKVRDERLTQLFAVAKQIGRKPVVEVLLTLANDKNADGKQRALALAALEGNVDTSNDANLKSFLAIAKSDAPDEVKHGALVRITAYNPDQAVKAYYELFDSPNWKVRFDGASSVISLMQKVGDKTKTTVREFIAHFPGKETSKMGLAEFNVYGTNLAALPKELKAKEAVDEALKSEKLGPLLVGLGWYTANGTPADLPMLEKFEKDKAPVPKCTDTDECGWDKPGCPVPKAGGKPDEVDYKPIATVGDYVSYCLKPQIEARAKAPPAPKEDKK